MIRKNRENEKIQKDKKRYDYTLAQLVPLGIYCIWQNFRMGKLSQLCTKYIIHWKIFAVRQTVEYSISVWGWIKFKTGSIW